MKSQTARIRVRVRRALRSGLKPLEVARKFQLSLVAVAEIAVANVAATLPELPMTPIRAG